MDLLKIKYFIKSATFLVSISNINMLEQSVSIYMSGQFNFMFVPERASATGFRDPMKSSLPFIIETSFWLANMTTKDVNTVTCTYK